MALQASLFQLAHAHLARMPCLGVSKLYKCAGLSGAVIATTNLANQKSAEANKRNRACRRSAVTVGCNLSGAVQREWLRLFALTAPCPLCAAWLHAVRTAACKGAKNRRIGYQESQYGQRL